MGTYTGWVDDLLSAASLPLSAENRQFLREWHDHATSDCRNNPIDLTHREPGSTNCRATGRVGISFQNYSSGSWARTAFNTQIHSGLYPRLLAALKASRIFELSGTDAGAIATDLGNWGSIDFANLYLAGQMSGSSAVRAPKAHGGWAALRVTFNHAMPKALHDSQRTTTAALRTLQKARKVRL